MTVPVHRTTPLEIMDDALLAVRRGGADKLLRAWSGSAPLALSALAIYYLERVEGLRSLRVPFALLLVLGFWVRSLSLSRVARDYALAIRPTLPVMEPPPRAVDVVCTASVVAFGLWIWLWPLSGMAMLSPLAVAAVLPFMALRGAVAPSWLARASCARERGMASFGQAFDDTSGMRGVFLIVELLALFGTIGVFSNLWAVLSFALLLGHSMLGLDVAFVSSFLSPDNGWVLLSITALTLVLLEPLRAAVSAQAFVDARSRRDGADLHAAVDEAIAQGSPRARRGIPSVPPGAAAVVTLGVVMLGAALLCSRAASAQPEPARPKAAAAQQPAGNEGDARIRAELQVILAGPEFREFAERDDKLLSDVIDKLLKALFDRDPDEAPEAHGDPIRLPDVSPWVLMALAIIALCLIAVYATAGRRQRRPAPVHRATAEIEVQPQDRPVTLLDEAAALAARGDMRGALRALYVATLLMLDHERLIEFEPWKTNGMYIRGMPVGEARASFAAFTRIFDRKWYGHEPATAEDYHECRRLAERIGGARSA